MTASCTLIFLSGTSQPLFTPYPAMSETQEELTEGYYFCPRCNRKTMHELRPQVLPHYETASEEEITELEGNCILTCISCADREETAYREEVFGE